MIIIGIFVLRGGMGDSALPYEGQTLRVYNTGEYTGENLIQDFEELTGAKVVMDLFESNEQMYIKIANGESYDVVIPSDYMIQRMITEELIQPIDKDNLNCFDLFVEDVTNLPYDPGNEYSVPYFWGTVGIVYDKTKVSEEELAKKGYNIFLDEKYKGDIYLYDSERDSFMMALKALGYSMNTTSEDELIEAYDWLEQCVETMEPEIVTDEISLGDFVLTGGELAAITIIDAVSRLVPGVLGKEESFEDESFSDGLLEYPQYTRPPVFMGREVPEVLLSGHHGNVAKWRREQALLRTAKKRPDLLKTAELTKKDLKFLQEQGIEFEK